VVRRLEALNKRAEVEAKDPPRWLATAIRGNWPTPEDPQEIAELEAARVKADMVARAEALKVPSPKGHAAGLTALEEAKKKLPGRGDPIVEGERSGAVASA